MVRALHNSRHNLELRILEIMNFVNLTPHAISLNDGTVFNPSGNVARVSATFTEFENGICHQKFGDVTGLPDPQEGTMFIVSALVLAATDRDDIVAPATGHPQCVRNDKGQIMSVPGFIGK